MHSFSYKYISENIHVFVRKSADLPTLYVWVILVEIIEFPFFVLRFVPVVNIILYDLLCFFQFIIPVLWCDTVAFVETIVFLGPLFTFQIFTNHSKTLFPSLPFLDVSFLFFAGWITISTAILIIKWQWFGDERKVEDKTVSRFSFDKKNAERKVGTIKRRLSRKEIFKCMFWNKMK